MKKITLHTAALDNGGTRRDGGDTVAVGTAADAIEPARAAELVTLGLAADAAAPAAEPAKADADA